MEAIKARIIEVKITGYPITGVQLQKVHIGHPHDCAWIICTKSSYWTPTQSRVDYVTNRHAENQSRSRNLL